MGEQLTFAGFSSELDRQHLLALDALARIDERRVIFTELLHQHGFAHATVAIDCQRWLIPLHPGQQNVVGAGSGL